MCGFCSSLVSPQAVNNLDGDLIRFVEDFLDDDDIPSQSCMDCYQSAYNAKRFRDQCKRTFEKLEATNISHSMVIGKSSSRRKPKWKPKQGQVNISVDEKNLADAACYHTSNGSLSYKKRKSFVDSLLEEHQPLRKKRKKQPPKYIEVEETDTEVEVDDEEVEEEEEEAIEPINEIFPSIGPYQCEICQNITHTKKEFVAHIKRYHIREVDESILKSLETDLDPKKKNKNNKKSNKNKKVKKKVKKMRKRRVLVTESEENRPQLLYPRPPLHLWPSYIPKVTYPVKKPAKSPAAAAAKTQKKAGGDKSKKAALALKKKRAARAAKRRAAEKSGSGDDFVLGSNTVTRRGRTVKSINRSKAGDPLSLDDDDEDLLLRTCSKCQSVVSHPREMSRHQMTRSCRIAAKKLTKFDPHSNRICRDMVEEMVCSALGLPMPKYEPPPAPKPRRRANNVDPDEVAMRTCGICGTVVYHPREIGRHQMSRSCKLAAKKRKERPKMVDPDAGRVCSDMVEEMVCSALGLPMPTYEPPPPDPNPEPEPEEEKKAEFWKTSVARKYLEDEESEVKEPPDDDDICQRIEFAVGEPSEEEQQAAMFAQVAAINQVVADSSRSNSNSPFEKLLNVNPLENPAPPQPPPLHTIPDPQPIDWETDDNEFINGNDPQQQVDPLAGTITEEVSLPSYESTQNSVLLNGNGEADQQEFAVPTAAAPLQQQNMFY